MENQEGIPCNKCGGLNRVDWSLFDGMHLCANCRGEKAVAEKEPEKLGEWYVGQDVRDYVYGNGKFARIQKDSDLYPIYVEFKSGLRDTYTVDGKSHISEQRTLYPGHEPLPRPKVKKKMTVVRYGNVYNPPKQTKFFINERECVIAAGGDAIAKGVKFTSEEFEVEEQMTDKEVIAELQDFAIWMTGCGYDFCQHEYFCTQRDKLLKNIPEEFEVEE